MKQPTIGLVIASYRYGHLAAHAIETALAQSKPFDKIWFVDDGAGDCGHLKEIYPGIEFIFRDRNMGIVDNFQDMLMNHVNTDYVMFLGADNWLGCETVETFHDYFEFVDTMKEYDIITYDIIVTGVLKQEIHKFYASKMTVHPQGYYWNRDGGHHGSMLYNVNLARSVGGYAHNRTSERTDEDLNIWNKMQAAGAKVLYIEQAFLYYRRHHQNFNKY